MNKKKQALTKEQKKKIEKIAKSVKGVLKKIKT